jgi:uncharacterized protein YciI
MAKFAVFLTYGDDSDQRQLVRPKHREYLWSLANEGKPLHAGPFADDSGSLIVYEAESLEEAEAMLAADPFSTEGVVIDSTIREWNRVLP